MSGVSLGERSGPFLSNLPFYTAVGLGLVPGVTRVTGLGHNPSIDIGTPEDIWEGGGTYPFLAAAATLEMLSTSAADTAAGTGCRTVLISGLNSSYNTISETVTLNGVTPVTTVNQYLRINLMTTTSSGSGEVNAGDITLRVSGGGTTVAIARAGYGFARQAVYTTPAGFTLFILSEVFSVLPADPKVNSGATFGGVLRSFTGNRRIPLEFPVISTGNPYYHRADVGIIMTEKSDFVLRVTSTGQNATNVTGAFEAMLFDNTKLVGL